MARSTKSAPGIITKNCWCEPTQVINTKTDTVNSFLKQIDTTFREPKRPRKSNKDNYHWVSNNKKMEVFNKRDKNCKTESSVLETPQVTKPANLQFNFDRQINQKICVPRQLDKSGKNEVAKNDSKAPLRCGRSNYCALLFRVQQRDGLEERCEKTGISFKKFVKHLILMAQVSPSLKPIVLSRGFSPRIGLLADDVFCNNRRAPECKQTHNCDSMEPIYKDHYRKKGWEPQHTRRKTAKAYKRDL